MRVPNPLARLSTYVESCGRVFGSARFLRRSTLLLRNKLATESWRLAVAELGSGSVIERDVEITTPRSVRIGDRCLVTRGSILSTERPDGRLVLEHDVDINSGVRLDYTGGLTVRAGALISENSVIMTHSHGHDPHSEPVGRAMVIGRDCWIGSHAMIMPSVTSIGDGAVIASGAIVTKDVAPGAIVACPPGAQIGEREVPRHDTQSG